MGGGPASPRDSDKRTYNVLVTGFGPFPDGKGGHYDKNGSHLISRALPSQLALTICESASAVGPSTPSLPAQQARGVPGSLHPHFLQSDLYPPSARTEHPEDFTDIRINIVHPTPTSDTDLTYIRTEYEYTRSFVHKLHDDIDAGTVQPKPDLILHLGQASYCNPSSPSSVGQIGVERLAFSQSMRCSWWSEREEKRGYHRIVDDKGETIEDVAGGRDPWAENGVPIGLGTGLDVDGVVRNVRRARASGMGRARPETPKWQVPARKEERQELDVVTHHEAGPYLCGFIYYESLAQCYVRRKRADVLFCHVPTKTDEESVARGCDAVCDVLGGAVEWLRETERKEREKLESEKEAKEDSAISAVA